MVFNQILFLNSNAIMQFYGILGQPTYIANLFKKLCFNLILCCNPSFKNIIGANRLRGETNRGAKRLVGAKRLGGK